MFGFFKHKLQELLDEQKKTNEYLKELIELSKEPDPEPLKVREYDIDQTKDNPLYGSLIAPVIDMDDE